ncbi:Hypothetical predicted protein, partial [Olea europaea subsp. europaea]
LGTNSGTGCRGGNTSIIGSEKIKKMKLKSRAEVMPPQPPVPESVPKVGTVARLLKKRQGQRWIQRGSYGVT